jgi:two-component system cell cycle response regulator
MSERPERQTVVLAAHNIASADPGPSDACLVVLYPPGPLMGRRVALERDAYVIGRSGDADLQLDRESVSRKHARIVHPEDGVWRIEDLGSTNGVYVNDAKVIDHRLADGDIIKIGDAIAKFLAGENVETAYHEEIYRLTIIDGLTGVHNKRHFLEFLEREVAAAGRYGHPLSLIMMDLDHFKQINDTQGHLVGDLVLKELAARIRPRIRREDLMARYGGEEFAIILTHTDQAGARIVGESVRALVADRPFSTDPASSTGGSLRVTVSLGIATLPLGPEEPPTGTGVRPSGRGPDPIALIKAADERLYAAKQAGRNRVMV